MEGELGTVGTTTEMGEEIPETYLTDPEQRGEFVARTKVDFERLEKIKAAARVPLAMHGDTGVPSDQVKRAIELAVAKIDFSTVLRKSFIDRMKACVAEHPDDPIR